MFHEVECTVQARVFQQVSEFRFWQNFILIRLDKSFPEKSSRK
ncbi:hypothetical protein LEP1GSC193_2943 [Leptospira alstonii serovar Pingchang str. 80-412]|uniref:Uncharacterized protein n=2 Tax=Leptospira alstonii TaxID=28452 RepID=M6CYW6_9LEPT|nr:hypothetical protein LEP1GSC194_3981 [Leptospira alstonii serovar Sichuan str. 79601]EQA81629.1 hypothetical protein LEP1GSC193_2943 [Leptospira alstonii serovar Pingchang str. 80-412]